MPQFDRHLELPDFTQEDQDRLASSRVLVVGLGGLGSPAARYLHAAGVTNLHLCDFDEVDETNLPRQILYAEHDLGKKKAELASERLPGTTKRDQTFDAALLVGMDLVVDCTDDPATRTYIFESCKAAGLPLVWGALHGNEGQITTFLPGVKALFPSFGGDKGCQGILGPNAGVVGTLMASEALNVLRGRPKLAGRMLLFDGDELTFDEVQWVKQ
ncbi:MAG: HesA/MoeB/ThiF family protein [Thermoplasmatota archaeon]